MNRAPSFLLTLLLCLPAVTAQASDDTAAELAAVHLQQLGGASSLELPSRVQIEHRLTLPWAAGTRVRFEQKIDGIPVLGEELIVSLDPSGQVRRVTGQHVRAGLVPAQPSFPAEDAEARAKGFIEALSSGTGELWPARSELRFLLDAAGEPSLVWQVDLSVAEPLGLYQVLVDARDGSLRGHRSTLFHALGNIYPTNPEVSELTEVELLGLPEDATTLNGAYAVVRSCDTYEDSFGGASCTEKSQHAAADADGNFLFDPDPVSSDDPLAEVQMYHHIDRVARWFEDEQSFTHPFPTEGIVNFDYNNAFFGDIDGDGAGEVAFGQTASIDYAYDADVIYHEFGHSVFGRIAGQTGFLGADEYGMEWSTGGLNEGTADLFSLVLTEDPELGEYAGSGGLGSSSIRDLEEDRHCPTDLYGESHRDGEVFGSFGWNLIDDEAIGAALTGDYIYGAVAAFPTDATWTDAGEALVTTAEEMLQAGTITQEQHDVIWSHLETAGLNDCGRVIRLDEGQEPTQLMVSVSFFTDRKLPAGQQLSLDAPPGTYRLRLRVKNFLTSDANLAWSLFVRRGEHIIHELETVDTPFGAVDLPIPTTYDLEIEGEGGEFSLELDEDSELQLEPGATYYFSLASRQTGQLGGFFANAEITVDGDAYIDDVPEADDDDHDHDAEGGSGCEGCSAAASQGGSHLLLLPLLGLLFLRRRS